MKKIASTILIVLFSAFIYSQELILDEGIYIEKPNPSDPAKDKYTRDNISYKNNTAFVFDYYYLDNPGAKKKFLQNRSWTDENPLNLIDYNSHSDSVINKIKLTIDEDLYIMPGGDSSYTQTLIGYDYVSGTGRRQNPFKEAEEITGLIDNKKNLWIHPPRSYTFKILEFCPFPFYYLDESMKRWTWQMEVGGPHYMDQRWIYWKEKIVIDYEYKRAPDESLNTLFGKLSCKVVNATASSEFGNHIMKTKLKSYYHPDYGFVKLEYDCINGSKLIMELTEVRKLRAKLVSDAKPVAEYYQACCTEYFNEKITLKEDSTFHYVYSYPNLNIEQTGRYRRNKDTLFLYNYEANPVQLKELKGEEIVNNAYKDSVEIMFRYMNTIERLTTRFYVNGKCPRKISVSSSGGYMVPKQEIKTISVTGGVYKVKNPNANKFIISYDPPEYPAFVEEKVKFISKCILKDDLLRRIDCDGTLDPGFKLNKR